MTPLTLLSPPPHIFSLAQCVINRLILPPQPPRVPPNLSFIISWWIFSLPPVIPFGPCARRHRYIKIKKPLTILIYYAGGLKRIGDAHCHFARSSRSTNYGNNWAQHSPCSTEAIQRSESASCLSQGDCEVCRCVRFCPNEASELRRGSPGLLALAFTIPRCRP